MLRYLPLLLALCLFGCNSRDSQISALNPAERGVVGTYQLKIALRKSVPEYEWNNRALNELEALPARQTVLDLLPSKQFLMKVGKREVKGIWRVDNDALYLRIESVAGVKPASVERVYQKDIGKHRLKFKSDEWNEFIDNSLKTLALERAEMLATMRIERDGRLTRGEKKTVTVFGDADATFVRMAQK